MRLLLSLVGAAALAATGWMCWRATEGSRDWREFRMLGTKPRRSDAERARLMDLGRRLFPDENFPLVGVTILGGPEEQKKVLVLFAFWNKGGRKARLHVLDEGGVRRSTSAVPAGSCGVECRPAPGRGPWAFDLALLTPASPTLRQYRLVEDRPVGVGPEAEPDDE